MPKTKNSTSRDPITFSQPPEEEPRSRVDCSDDICNDYDRAIALTRMVEAMCEAMSVSNHVTDHGIGQSVFGGLYYVMEDIGNHLDTIKDRAERLYHGNFSDDDDAPTGGAR